MKNRSNTYVSHNVHGGWRWDDAFVFTGELPVRDVRNSQRIVWEDGTQIDVPRPVPTDTAEWGLSWTGVMEALNNHPQSHAKGRNTDRRVPVRYVVLVVVGLALMGVGMSAQILAPLIWAVIPR